MTCKDVADFLDLYLAGELPRVKQWVFDAHIALCKDCQNYIAGYRRSMELAKQAMATPREPSNPIPEDLIQAILRANTR